MASYQESGYQSTIFRYSHRIDPFSLLVGTVFRYAPGFSYFSILTLIRPFSSTRQDNFSILKWFLPLPGTLPNSIIFRHSHWFDPFFVIAGTVFPYLHGFYLFPVLSRILLFFGTHTDSTLFRYSSEQFFDTRMDSTFSRYSPGF